MEEAVHPAGFRRRIEQPGDAIVPTIVGYHHLVLPELKLFGRGAYETELHAADFIHRAKQSAHGWTYTIDVAQTIFDQINQGQVEIIDGRPFNMVSAAPSQQSSIDYTKTGFGGTQDIRIWGRHHQGVWGAFGAYVTLHDAMSNDDQCEAELCYDDFGYRLLLLHTVAVCAEFDETCDFKPVSMDAKLWLLRPLPPNITVKWRFQYNAAGDNPYLETQTFAYERAGSSWCQLEFCDVTSGKKAWANVKLFLRNPLCTTFDVDPFIKPTPEVAQRYYAKPRPVTALNYSIGYGTSRQSPDVLDPRWLVLPMDPNPPEVTIAVPDSLATDAHTKLTEFLATIRAGTDWERNLLMHAPCSIWD